MGPGTSIGPCPLGRGVLYPPMPRLAPGKPTRAPQGYREGKLETTRLSPSVDIPLPRDY